MSPEMKAVFDFCLERAEQATPAVRAKLYRGLAEFCGDPQLAAKFRSAAEAIETADHLQRELILKFTPRRRDGDGHRTTNH